MQAKSANYFILYPTSLNLGCCGIGAFYDDETIDLLCDDGGVRLLYLVAIGITKS
ncbi:MAG: hypothetical protein PVG39_20680 [Desulfobacteraceae bacterium]|jgi:nitroreductase